MELKEPCASQIQAPQSLLFVVKHRVAHGKLYSLGSMGSSLHFHPMSLPSARDHLCHWTHLQMFPQLSACILFLGGCKLVLSFHFGFKQFSNCSRVRESNLVAQDSKLFQAIQNIHFAHVIFLSSVLLKRAEHEQELLPL